MGATIFLLILCFTIAIYPSLQNFESSNLGKFLGPMRFPTIVGNSWYFTGSETNAMWTTFALLSISFSIVIYRLRNFSQRCSLEKLPGPMRFPIIGNTWKFAKSEQRLLNLRNVQRKYGNRVYVTGGFFKGLLVFHPDDIEIILNSKELMNKSTLYEFILSDWLGSSLFYAKGKEYFRKRKMLLPSFDVKRVDNFEGTLNDNSKVLVNLLKAKEAKGEVTDIQHLVKLFSLDTSFQYLVGKSLNSLVDRSNDKYTEAVHNEVSYVTQRGSSPWLWPSPIWKYSSTGKKEKLSRKIMHDFMDKIVNERKEELMLSKETEESNCEGRDEYKRKEKLKCLDLLIRKQEQGESGVTNKYVRDEMNLLLFAAHDTAASALTFAIYLLSTHPEEQLKVQTELDQVFGEDKAKNVEASDLSKLKYLECCIKESLRLYPPAPYTSRVASQNFTIDEDLTIPKGAEIVLVTGVTHRLAQFFPSPDDFIPSRFFPENSVGRHPYAFFPFSGGSRSCMGQKIAMEKIKTVLAHIFRNFTLELASGSEEITAIGDIIQYIKNGLNVSLKSR